MSLMQIFNVSGSAASAQGQRLNTVASNLANADSIAEPGAQPYRARQVVFQTMLMGNGGSAGFGGDGVGTEDGASAGVRVSNIVESNDKPRRVHSPGHAAADAEGYVTYSNVSPIDEMANMISASRAYQSNIDVMNTAKALLGKTLQLGQG